jgi:peptidoglycan/LPS O-acetylase OafA/YrhL
MTMLSTWPSIAIVALAIAVLSARRVFAFLDASPSAHAHRLDSIDGLRGILASAVFIHHFSMTCYNYMHHTTGAPPDPFYGFIGTGSVSVFFMITGYLFWGRLLDRKGDIKWPDLYINRLFRVYPLYLFLILMYFGWVAWHAGVPANEPVESIVGQTLQWLAFGAVQNPDPFLTHGEYIGLVGQTWSLHWEWAFYLALPALAVFARERSAIAVTGGLLLMLMASVDLVSQPNVFFIEQFLIGMLTASVLRAFPRVRADGIVRSLVALAAIAAAIWFSDGLAYANNTTALLGIFFFLVASGASLFGALTTTGAKRLGNLSYSIYMLHGLLINVIFTFTNALYHVSHSDRRYWVVTAVMYAIVVCVSIATYSLIEKPGIEMGRRIIKRLPQFKEVALDRVGAASPRGDA